MDFVANPLFGLSPYPPAHPEPVEGPWIPWLKTQKKGANSRPPPSDSACLYHFKQAGCALAAADAHGDHHVLGAAALTLDQGMAGQA